MNELLGRRLSAGVNALGTALSDVAQDALHRLQSDFPAESTDTEPSGDAIHVLKGLLLEFEVAVDLFLRIAETGKTEAVVDAAHTAAERYLGGLSVVRDQLDYLIHQENQQ